MAYTDISGKKLREKLGCTLNEASAAPISKNSFAQKQLEKFGWKKGDGLGARGNGIKTHIRVHKREEDIGLGHEKQLAKEASNMWWSSSVSDTLAKLAKEKNTKKDKKKKSKKEKKSSSDSSKKRKDKKRDPNRHFTDEELFKATGGARFGMRAICRSECKWKRAETNISKEMEEEALKKMEWNGRGKAEIILNHQTNGSGGGAIDQEEKNKKMEKANDKREKDLALKEQKLEKEEEGSHIVSASDDDSRSNESDVNIINDKTLKKRKKKKKEPSSNKRKKVDSNIETEGGEQSKKEKKKKKRRKLE